MYNKTDFIVEKIKKFSQKPPENERVIRLCINQSLRGTPITFYNWECPPRVLIRDRQGRLLLNYLVDIDKVFRGEKIDKYTEIPRVVKDQNREIKILKLLNSLGIKFRFVKIIADTNAYYITPNSLEALGEKNIRRSLSIFKRKIKEITDKAYSVKPKVYLFTKLMSGFRSDYDTVFNESLKLLAKPADLIRQKTWNEEINYLRRHIGFRNNQKDELVNFARRTIATYAAEGITFDLLSRTEYFSNCVWLNIEEMSDRVVEITNCLRIKKGLGAMPMIFPV
ncbi:hypothetical protein HYV91_01695 [Candidatus Wolfebacteria bacterium]|nr:hypothetical protein [Candidatus Wolfebacteria bacterium]